jgi:hypothetical protein
MIIIIDSDVFEDRRTLYLCDVCRNRFRLESLIGLNLDCPICYKEKKCSSVINVE